MTTFKLSRTLRAPVGAALLVAAGRRWARRQVVKARSIPDAEQFALSSPVATRIHRIPAQDGVHLHVQEFGDATSPTTVVLVHGWTLSSDLWSGQVARLADHARVVAYDHRGHGRSDRSADQIYSIDQLGADLATVIDHVAPTGRLVLVGHSMGGMTVMHLAARRPELFQDRVKGVVLVSTSLGDLANLNLGLPRPFGLFLRRFGKGGLRTLARLEDSVSITGPVAPELWLAARKWNFGPNPAARHVDDMMRVMRRTPLSVISGFYGALLDHDGSAGLPALRNVPVTIVVGDLDQLTPLAHARRLSKELPDASLKIVSGASHMIILENPEDVVAPIVAQVTNCSEQDLASVGG